MAKVLAFAGSPRREGYTNTLLRKLIEGVESKKGEVKVYDLNSPEPRGCQGCFRRRAEPGCPIDDSLAPAYAEIADASGIVVTSPIYFGQISGQAKLWLDRMVPMLDGKTFKPRHPGKKAATIFSQGDANGLRFASVVNQLHGFLQTFGWEPIASIVCSGVSDPDFTLSDELLAKARTAGEALAG